MKSAILKKTQLIEICDVPKPTPSEGEVLVRVHFTGVCGSDVPRFEQGRVHSFPLVLGHEFSGIIEEVGPSVDTALKGRRVAGIPLIPCGECDECKKGAFSQCGSYGFVGSRSNGSMAEYVCLPATNVYPLADDVTDLQGAFFEPATVAIHGIELVKLRGGRSAIVLGGGTIGLLLAQALQGYGITRPVVTQRSESRFEAAKSVGLEHLVATDTDNWQDKARDLVGATNGFDYVFDTAGTPTTILQALEVAAPHAKVCFVGTPKGDVVFTSKQWELINRKELMVTGSWMSYSAPWPGIEWDIVNQFFADGVMHVADKMIDAVYPLAKTNDALLRFCADKKPKGKVVIDSWS